MATENNTINTTVKVDASSARKEIVKTNEAATSSQDKLNSSLSESKETIGALDGATGGLGSKFSGLIGPLKGVASGFRTIGGAIALSGIGAIVLTLLALKAAFTGSEEGQNKFAKLMGMIGAVTGNLMDILADLGEFIIGIFENPKKAINDFAKLLKQNIINRFEGMLNLIPALGKAVTKLFSGDFKEAGKIAADAVGKVATGMESVTDSINNATAALGGFIEEQKKEALAAGKVADLRASAVKLDRELLVERAKNEAKIAELKLNAREDDKFSAAQRKKFLLEAQAIEDKLLSKEKISLQQKLDAQKLENTFSRTDIENLDKEAEAEAALFLIEAKRFKEQKATQRELLRVNNEIAKDNKARRDAEAKEEQAQQDLLKQIKAANTQAEIDLAQTEIDAKKSRNEETLDLELALLEAKRIQAVEQEGLTLLEIRALNEQNELEKTILKQEAREAELELKRKQAEEDRELQLELDELDIEARRMKGENVLALELELLEKKRLQDVSVADLSAKAIEVINAKSAAAKKKILDAEEKASKAKEAAVLDNALNGAAEAFGIAQEVSVARMIMEAPQAIAGSFKNAATSYAPPLSLVMGALGAAGTVVPIIKGLADIKKARFPRKSKKGGGSSASSASISTSAASAGGGASAITPEVVSDLASNNSARLGLDTDLGNGAGAAASNNVLGGASQGIVFSEAAYSSFQNQVAFKEEKITVS